MNTVVVNGKRYNLPSENVSIVNGVVYCDGKAVTENAVNDIVKEIKIVINGNIDALDCDEGNITVNGSVNTIESDTGNVTVNGDVNGDITVDTGNVKCGHVGGEVKTGCGNIISTLAKKSSKFIKNIKGPLEL